MKTKSVHYSKLANRIARQTARFASVATSDTIYGGARALSLAKHFDRFHVNFSDGVSAAEIVSHVYGNSTGRTCERFGAFECPECGCVSLGVDLARTCCEETEEELTEEEIDLAMKWDMTTEEIEVDASGQCFSDADSGL